jgi:heat-inducible transcriptional repressor
MLDERARQVLVAVIECYTNSLAPVGSRLITKRYAFGLSPATIRNIMADLEEMGFLRQPHTSAGRVPTDLGYRYYVDAIKTEKQNCNADMVLEITRKLEILRKDINSVLDEASRVMSTLSHYIGITMSPTENTTTMEKVEFIKYRENRMAVILFTDEGIIQNKVIPVDAEISQKDLNRIAEHINTRFSGSTLQEIRQSVIMEISRETALCDSLISEAIKICRDVFTILPGQVYISGISEVLALPDFCEIDRIKDLLKTIEDKQVIVQLLDRISESDGTQIFIGSENPVDEMKKFSLVAATYKEGSRPIGAIAIIGPIRMNYPQAISVVDQTASYITEILSFRNRR